MIDEQVERLIGALEQIAAAIRAQRSCNECGGSGRIPAGGLEWPCTACDGSGYR